MSHPRGVVWSLEPLKKALRERDGYPKYFIAPFNLENYWWGTKPPPPLQLKSGVIHNLTFPPKAYCRGNTLHQLYLSGLYLDFISFNMASGPPRVTRANRGWFYNDHYRRNFPAVYLFENYWFAFAYVQKLGLDK